MCIRVAKPVWGDYTGHGSSYNALLVNSPRYTSDVERRIVTATIITTNSHKKD